MQVCIFNRIAKTRPQGGLQPYSFQDCHDVAGCECERLLRQGHCPCAGAAHAPASSQLTDTTRATSAPLPYSGAVRVAAAGGGGAAGSHTPSNDDWLQAAQQWRADDAAAGATASPQQQDVVAVEGGSGTVPPYPPPEALTAVRIASDERRQLAAARDETVAAEPHRSRYVG